MLNREELKEMAKMRGDGAFFVSLYLNVNPVTNIKDNYVIHVKNMLKQTADSMEKDAVKRITGDLEKIESYILSNKRIFKKGLAILSSREKNFWKEFHLALPLKNEIVVDNTPYIKPLFDILDNYRRYAILLVGKESARLFLMHLGEIEEYSEVSTADVPGKHKKGGWFALSEKSYERHTDYHVELHLKDVLKQLESFLSGEYVDRMVIGGSEEAATKVRAMLPQTTAAKVIGTFQAEMFANSKEILEKVEPVLVSFEEKKEAETIDDLLQLLVDRLALRQQVVQRGLAEHAAERGLRDLEGGADVVEHLQHGLPGAHNAEVDDGVHLHRHVVLGDRLLARHVHRHDAKVRLH